MSKNNTWPTVSPPTAADMLAAQEQFGDMLPSIEKGSCFHSDCPHCGVKKVSFTFPLSSVYQYLLGGSSLMATLAVCGHCRRPVMATFGGNNPARGFLRLPEWLDPSSEQVVPDHTHGSVARRYKEALNNMASGSHESAIMMFRKTLQLALGTVVPRKGRKLIDQIKDAAADGVISKELADSADVVRLGGNVAAHEETEFSPDEVLALKGFTEMVLVYLFTLPGMLDEWKKHVQIKEERVMVHGQRPPL